MGFTQSCLVSRRRFQTPNDTTPEKTLHLLIFKLIETLLLHFNFNIFLSVYGLWGSETIHIVLLYLTINSLFSSFTKMHSAYKEFEDLSALKQTRLNKQSLNVFSELPTEIFIPSSLLKTLLTSFPVKLNFKRNSTFF